MCASQTKKSAETGFASAIVSACFVSAHLSLLAYMLLSMRLYDPILLKLLFFSGMVSIGSLAVHEKPLSVFLMIMCMFSTFYSALYLSALMPEYEVLLKWGATILVTYVVLAKGGGKDSREKKRNGVKIVALIMTINMLLCLMASLFLKV